MKKILLAATAALAMAAGSANAAITVTSQSGYANSTAPAKPVVIDFESGTLGGGFSFTDVTGSSGGYVSGIYKNLSAPGFGTQGVDGVAANPYNDTSGNFFAVLGGGSATLKGFTSQATGLSLFIGSVDTYNTVSFYGPGNTQLASFDGTSLLQNAAPADGEQQSDKTNREFSFAFNGADVDHVVFTSTGNSLEFDNVAVSAAPEPGVWAMMFMGVGLAGGALRLSRRRQIALLAA